MQTLSSDIPALVDRLDDIHDEIDALPLPTHEFPWVGTIAGVLLVAALIAVVVWYRRRRRPLRVESLEGCARRRLDELAAAENALDARAFHGELADILVRYVEARLALRSTRLTSGEIVREFERNGVMSGEWLCALRELFAECDCAKFGPGPAEWDGASVIARCRGVVDALAVQVAASPRLANPWEGWKNAAV